MMNFDHEIKNQLQNYLLMQGILSNQTVWHAQTGGQTNKVWRLKGEKDLICKLLLKSGLVFVFKYSLQIKSFSPLSHHTLFVCPPV